MSSELKPCPFCGCEPTLDRFNARCPGCDAEINAAPGLAAEAWNRRAPSPAVKALVEATRDYLMARAMDELSGDHGVRVEEALAAVEREIQQ